jgi:hypothetical protein
MPDRKNSKYDRNKTLGLMQKVYLLGNSSGKKWCFLAEKIKTPPIILNFKSDFPS